MTGEVAVSGSTYVKIQVTQANISFLVRHLPLPHMGLIVSAVERAARASFGGLWLDADAWVSGDVLEVDCRRSAAIMTGQDFSCEVYLPGARVSVERNPMLGGFLPSSRLITIVQNGSEVKLGTPNGGGDALGEVIASGA